MIRGNGKMRFRVQMRRALLWFMTAATLTAAAEPEPDYQHTIITGETNRPESLYRPGEPMQFRFQILNAGKPVSGRLQIIRVGDDGRRLEQTLEVTARTPALFTSSLNRPGCVMVKAVLLDASGKAVRRKNPAGALRMIQYGLGAGVEPEKLLPGTPEPSDFDAFWQRQRQRLGETPPEVLSEKLFRETPTHRIYDISIRCAGPRPCTGYLSIPKLSSARKIPARLRYEGYSVQSAVPETAPDRMVFTVSAHGLENGRSADYYRTFAEGELRNYGFSTEENHNPETVYFKQMILRDLRAVDYLITRPEWDKQTLEISAGSQGAFQACAVAALRPEITRCELAIPWFCDLGGIRVGRMAGWRPEWTPALDYFDPVNFAARISCPVSIDAGWSDWVCPPSGIWVLYNRLRSTRKLILRQGLDHARYLGYRHGATARCLRTAAANAGKSSAPAPTTVIHVNPGKIIAPVNPMIFGHNIEASDPRIVRNRFDWKRDSLLMDHGGGFWDPVARRAVPAARELAGKVRMGVLRYPGGCLTHGYNWKKAIGPVADRPQWQFGLNEYL